MASFCAAFFPLDVLDEIWDLIESVSEGFLTYSSLFITILDAYNSIFTYPRITFWISNTVQVFGHPCIEMN